MKTRSPLQLYNVREPMERVAIDVLGPLPETDSGNKYILIAMDYFSKWPEAYALPNQEAVTVANVLVSQFFSRFGVPAELHSDQGRNFESFGRSAPCMGSIRHRQPSCILCRMAWLNVTIEL